MEEKKINAPINEDDGSITLAPIDVWSDDTYEKEREKASSAMAGTIQKEAQSITEAQVLKDPEFVNAYGTVAAYMGKDTEGTTQEDLAKEGLQFVSDMIIPLTTLDNEGLAGLAQLAYDADPQTKQAMAYMYNTVENKDTTWSGFARGLKSVGKDPSLYAGVATGGWSFFGREAAKDVVKRTIGTMLVSGMATSAYMGAEEGVVQEVEDTYGDKPTDWNKVQQMTEMGAIMGLAMPLAFEGGIQAVGATGKAIGRGVGSLYKQGEELAMQSAGGGKPPVKTIEVDKLFEAISELTTKEKQKQLSGSLRFLEGEDKQRAISYMKELSESAPKKPKPKKVQEVITKREDFNEQFYSRAEHVFDNIDENSENIADDMLKQGVRQSELDSLGIKPTDDYNTVQNRLNVRSDKITKNTLDADTAGSIIDEDDYTDYLSINEGRDVSEGESGYGARITDEYTGAEIEIGGSYHDDLYVDDSGSEFTRDEMLDDWLRYYYDGEKYTDEMIDAGVDMDDADEVAKNIKALAEEDGEYMDNYFSKEYYTSEVSNKHYDTMSEAIEDTKSLMYEDYKDRAEYEGGNGEIFEDYTIEGGDNYKMEVYRMEDFQASAPGTKRHYEPHLGQINQEADNVQVHARMKTRTDSNGKEGTVLEEVQSQWEQDWRKQGGGKKLPTKEERAVAQAKVTEVAEESKAYNEKHIMPLVEEQAKQQKKLKRIRFDHQDDIKVDVDNLMRQKDELEPELRAIRDDARSQERMSTEWSESQTKYRELNKIVEKLDDKIEDLQAGYNNNPKYIKAKKISDDSLSKAKEHQKIMSEIRLKSRDANKILDTKPPKLAEPPMKNRTQYTKLAMLDNLTSSMNDGEEYFGWINGHIQNGSKIDTTVGMSQAYDIEMPRIIQKSTGETPYMASFDDGLPISGERIKWDGKRAMDLEYYNDLSDGEDWYWRIDYTPELKKKLKDAKIEVFGVGGVSLIGANESMDKDAE